MQKIKNALKSLAVAIFTILPLTTGLAANLPNHRYETYRDTLENLNVIEESSLKVETPVTIEQFLRFSLRNIEDFNPRFDTPNERFINVPNIQPYAPYVYTALNIGLIDMPESKRFNPKQKLTKKEGLEMLFNLYGLAAPKIHDIEHQYSDIEKNSDTMALVVKAIDLDLIGPEQIDYFGINELLTVGELARMLVEVNEAITNAKQPTEVLVGLPDIEDIDVFFDVYSKIEEFYYYEDEIDQKELTKKAIMGLVRGLEDNYSVYNEPTQTNNFIEQTSGDFQGVGMWIETNGEYITVAGVIPDSPAEKGGMKVGDTILKINGEDISGWSPEKAAAKIKGPEGSTVELYIEKHPTSVKKSVILTRAQISLKFVESKIVDTKYAYFDISQFPQDLAIDFTEQANSLITDQTKGIILDLRNNPGGYVSAAEDLLFKFLEPKQRMYTLDYRSGQRIARAFGKGKYSNYPIVVLVDASTASASEIVAAALKENGKATIVGQQTFGKGVAQQLFFYEDGSSLKLTIAEWLTPNGNRLNKVGVTPDIVVADNEKTDTDEILERALRYLKNGR